MNIKRTTSLLIIGFSTLSLIGCSNQTEESKIIYQEVDTSTSDTPTSGNINVIPNENQYNHKIEYIEDDKENDIEITDEIEENREVVLYIPNSDVDDLNKVISSIPNNTDTAQYIIDTLIEKGFIAPNTKVNKFNKISDDIYQLDLSKEFYNSNLGSSAEILLLDSIGNSFTETFDIDKVKLTIDDMRYTSGHIEMQDTDYIPFNKIRC